MSTDQLSLYQERKTLGYLKAYIPLESDPEIFSQLTQNLGLQGYEFHDVLSLDDPDLLAFIPRPVLGLVFVFPASDWYDQELVEQEKHRPVYQGKGEDEPVIWFAQTIQNACGLYAVLHALSNGVDRSSIEPGSPLDQLLTEAIPLSPPDRALALENSKAIEAAHAAAGAEGGTTAEPNDEVDYHYICFVRSKKDKHIYDMNGCAKGPIDTGVVQESEDLLDKGVIKLAKEYIARAAGNVGFSLMALAPM